MSSQPPPSSSVSVGASSGQAAFQTYTSTLGWIKDARSKLPGGTNTRLALDPVAREEAYNLCPLLKGIIMPFLKNVVIGAYHFETPDNKKYSAAITDFWNFITDIKLISLFRDDFEYLAIKDGHQYFRKDYDPLTGEIASLQRLEPGSIRVYEDPWDTSIKAYHQKINIQEAWSTSAQTKEFNSWFIPGGLLFVEGGAAEKGAKELFEFYKTRYKITDFKNLRVSSSDRIVAMHRVKPGDPAPIDSVYVNIWLEVMLTTNSPNLVFMVLNPFFHVKSGMMAEVMEDGEKRIESTVPGVPSSDQQQIDPEQYASEMADHEAWKKALEEAVKNILSCMKNGGAYGSGPDLEINVVESGRPVDYLLIRNLIDILDEKIGQAFGFPVSLVMAQGAELATSRTINRLFNTVYSGVRLDYQAITDSLIKERFENTTWSIEVENEEGNIETITYGFQDVDPSFILDMGDVEDALKQAQAQLNRAKELQTLKQIGASKKDIQSRAETLGFGELGLDNYDSSGAGTQTPSMPGSMRTGSTESLLDPPQGAAVSVTDPESDPVEDNSSDLEKKLLEAYSAAKGKIQENL
ncbi:hypothetical protein [Methanosarcina sp.]|uniref:hypothetical protein n=1 Tax=Methanosarcina sp. TaxID=2213 RepID=UPI003BB7B9D2